jgi:hypothetical protein
VYNGALTDVFKVALSMACVAIVPALCMEWRSVMKEKGMEMDEERGAAVENDAVNEETN